MEASEDTKFTVTINNDGYKEQVEIQYAETTDGIPYYICKMDGKEAQIRKDDKWEQLWGDLSQDQVDELGKAITQYVETL